MFPFFLFQTFVVNAPVLILGSHTGATEVDRWGLPQGERGSYPMGEKNINA